jgi:hypothetical protein
MKDRMSSIMPLMAFLMGSSSSGRKYLLSPPKDETAREEGQELLVKRLLEEYELIQKKESKLGRKERDSVVGIIESMRANGELPNEEE